MYIAVQTVLIFGVGAAILLKFTTIEMKAMVYSVLTALTFCLVNVDNILFLQFIETEYF